MTLETDVTMHFLCLPYHIQVHSRAAGGTGEQCVSDRGEHAVPGDEGASGERTAGYETVPVTLQGSAAFLKQDLASRRPCCSESHLTSHVQDVHQ